MQKLIIFVLICYNQTIFLAEDFSYLKECRIMDPKCIEIRKKCKELFYSNKEIPPRIIAQCMAIRFPLSSYCPLFGRRASEDEKKRLNEWDSIALDYRISGK